MMKFSSKVNIRFVDIDALGHVNNAVFLNFFEEGRIAWFNKLVGKNWDWKKHGAILARNEIDYLQPLLFNDQATIEVKCDNVGNKSISLSYTIHKNGNDIVAKGRSVLVCYDYEKDESVPVYSTWKKKLGV